jgi:hypothetical protein
MPFNDIFNRNLRNGPFAVMSAYHCLTMKKLVRGNSVHPFPLYFGFWAVISYINSYVSGMKQGTLFIQTNSLSLWAPCALTTNVNSPDP